MLDSTKVSSDLTLDDLEGQKSRSHFLTENNIEKDIVPNGDYIEWQWA